MELNVNDINVQVFQLLEDLYTYGMESSPRGQKVKEANIATLDINPTLPIMNFQDRPFNYKYFCGEVAWYLMKNRNIDFINKFSSFWKKLTINNNVNSNYGHILLDEHPSTVYSKDENGYPLEKTNQLEWAYSSLVKDKDSRQAVAFLNCPYYQYEGNKDFVCTMYLNFWIRKDTLDMKVQMRSNDIFFGLSYDAPWFALIHQTMYLNLKKIYPELKLGMYFHCADNIHYYERHFELVDSILESDIISSPKFILKAPLFTFEDKETIISESASSYIDKLHNVVNSEAFSTMSQADWKDVLRDIVYIDY